VKFLLTRKRKFLAFAGFAEASFLLLLNDTAVTSGRHVAKGVRQLVLEMKAAPVGHGFFDRTSDGAGFVRTMRNLDWQSNYPDSEFAL
jgi:hypothetical protein